MMVSEGMRLMKGDRYRGAEFFDDDVGTLLDVVLRLKPPPPLSFNPRPNLWLPVERSTLLSPLSSKSATQK